MEKQPENPINARTKYEDRFISCETLIKEVLAYIYSKSCICAYPRLIQILAIDCFDYNAYFQCCETTIILHLCKDKFDNKSIKDGYEKEQKWICSFCRSEYIYYENDLSAFIIREVLKPIDIKVPAIGKEGGKPIPLYAGLFGNKYPERSEIYPVSEEVFKKYLLEEQ